MNSERWVLSRWSSLSDTARLPRELERHAITFGDDTVVLAPESGPGSSDADGLRSLAGDLSLPTLHLVAQVGNRFEAEHPEVPVLYSKGRYLVVAMDPQRARDQAQRGCYAIEPISIPDVVFDVRRREGAVPAADAATSDLLAALSRQRLEESLEHLVSFGTSSLDQCQYKEAAQWAADSMAADGYQVRLEQVAVGGGQSWNVIAERPGSGNGSRDAVVVTAHLDSVNHEVQQGPAPGADDNGTGAAGVLELAHCLAGRSCARDLRFILFGGEEQGLFGSLAYVGGLPSPPAIHTVINMDMIGTLNGTTTPTVMIEGGQVSVPLMDRLVAAAETYTDLTIQTSLHYFNSDHVPFIDAGIPGVLLIEGNDSANTRVHTARDTMAHVDFDLMSNILRMHLAVLATSCDA